MHFKTAFQRCSIFTGILALAVLSCSGLADVSNLLATDTPTSTSAFTPSPTWTPSPTLTPTETPSPSPTPRLSGSTTEKQSDGSTLFTDYDNKYLLALPSGWMVIPLSSEDMADILQTMSAENPELKDIAETFKNMDPDVIRVMALNMDPKYMKNGISTSLSVMAIENKPLASMPMEFVTGALKESIKQQGAELLSSGSPVITNANGVELGSVEYRQTVPSPGGVGVPVLYKVVGFRTGDKMIMLQPGTPTEFGEDLLPVVDQIAESIKLIEP